MCHLAPVKTPPRQRPLGARVAFLGQDPCLLIQLVAVKGYDVRYCLRKRVVIGVYEKVCCNSVG